MKMTRLTIAPADTDFLQIGRVSLVRVDTTTDKEIALQQAINDAETIEKWQSSCGECDRGWG